VGFFISGEQMTDVAGGEVQVEESEAAFSAGFDGPAEQSAAPTESVETAATETTATEEAAPTTEEKPVLIAGMTEAEWNAAVTKAAQPLVEQARAETRKNFGQIGNVERAIKDIQTKLAASPNTAARRKLTADLFKRVDAELPGFGGALAQDLDEILNSPVVAAEAAQAQATAEAKGQVFDQDAFIAEKIAPALSDIETRINERAELRIVKSIHRDFDAVMKSPDFAGWLGTLPADRQKAIRESEDGFVAADAVTEFKEAKAKTLADKQKKQDRLDRATTPSGDRRPANHVPQDDETLFKQGFASVK
jgi:hypothetical protein